ncbi:MAG: HNH endonuclease [Alphaproteobacteria bacterium]|nr:HNH endonuclease [Alphaproteobacteria bacterium]
METIINKLKILPKLFVLLIFFQVLDCHADDFDEYLNKITTIVKNREDPPKKIYKKQREILINHKADIRELRFDVLDDHNIYVERRKSFDSGGRIKLIKKWEEELSRFRVFWPKYNCDNCCRQNGGCNHHYFEAHHVIPLGYNGENEWWNIFPLTQEEHTGEDGMHSSGEARNLFPKVKK